MVVAPPPCHREIQFVAAAAFERPAIVFDAPLEHVERVTFTGDFVVMMGDGHPTLLDNGWSKRSTLRST
jgi:hypothetical protein